MEEVLKNDKQTLESVKFPLEERERQNNSETLKRVKKFPMGLPLSPNQFKELFLQKSSNKATNFRRQIANLTPVKTKAFSLLLLGSWIRKGYLKP